MTDLFSDDLLAALRDGPPTIDTSTPNAARMWNCWLSGKDTYAADRHAADLVARLIPGIVDAARHNRAFLGRAVSSLAEAGTRQFLDIGVGLPTIDNTHEIAQRTRPDARVVYIDNDPLVLAHARALLASSPQGRIDVVDADVRDTTAILADASRTLDFGEPVTVLMLEVLNHIVDDDQAQSAVERLVAVLAPGSHLVIAHPTAELHGDLLPDTMQLVTEMGGPPNVARTPDRIAGFFTGLHLLKPGVVSSSHWRPGPVPWQAPPVLQYCGIARKADRTGPHLAGTERPAPTTAATAL